MQDFKKEIQDAFNSCKTKSELKQVYRNLIFKFHPDRGGAKEAAQYLIEFYLQAQVRFFGESDAKQSQQSKQTEKEQDEIFNAIVSELVKLQNLDVEICGSWIWIGGETKTHKNRLKELGCYFAPKKVLWYFRLDENKSFNKKTKTIEEIRAKYGSRKVTRASVVRA